METPLTKAAKRAEVLFEDPMVVALPSQTPVFSRYCRQRAPVCARDPANASPKPSRIDFLPNSITSAGISSYFVVATNRLTYSVRPWALGKSLPGRALAPPAELTSKLDAITPRAAFPQSRLRMFHLDPALLYLCAHPFSPGAFRSLRTTW